MGWKNTEAYIPAVGADVRVGIQKIGKGNPRFFVTMSADVLEKLGDPDTCDLFIGEGDETGQVLLQVDGEGVHSIRNLNKGGGGKVTINAAAEMPQDRRRPTGVRHQVGKGEGGEWQITIWLPW